MLPHGLHILIEPLNYQASHQPIKSLCYTLILVKGVKCDQFRGIKPRLLFDKRCTVRFFKKISYTKFCGHKTQILTNHQEDQTLKSKILT